MKLAQKQFINWVKKNDPGLYALALRKYQKKGLGFLTADFFNTLADTVKTAVPAAIQYKQQSQILKAQVERAKQGLPPLQTAEYAPTIKVAPTFDPAAEAALTRMAMQTTQTGVQKLMPVFIAGIGAIVLVMVMRNRPVRRGRR